jgi:hypothetical protein
MSLTTASIPATCRVSEFKEAEDGKSFGIRFSNGRTRGPRHLIRYGKVKLGTGALSPRYGSQRIGIVCTDAKATITTLTYHTVVSFGFYHFACIMLLTYKPGPKFAIRNTASLSDTNVSGRRTEPFHIPTNTSSKLFSTMLELYVVPANVLRRQSSSRLLSVIQYLSGDRWF